MNADARNMLWIMLVAALVFILALAARLGLVENESLLVACSGLADAACDTAIVAREAVVHSFVGGHLGWTAVFAAGIGLVAHWRPAAWSAWILGIAGMVLYNVEPASAAALLALLLLARKPSARRQHQAQQ
ncbi:MAG: hypothetical protein KDG52_01605 [Rhodocyclaceae bacterium]|nr:hypothetical protein [Rhodocyclaceae bacterium]